MTESLRCGFSCNASTWASSNNSVLGLEKRRQRIGVMKKNWLGNDRKKLNSSAVDTCKRLHLFLKSTFVSKLIFQVIKCAPCHELFFIRVWAISPEGKSYKEFLEHLHQNWSSSAWWHCMHCQGSRLRSAGMSYECSWAEINKIDASLWLILIINVAILDASLDIQYIIDIIYGGCYSTIMTRSSPS